VIAQGGPADLFHGLSERIERDPSARHALARRVANRSRVLDIGGRNGESRSARWIRMLSDGEERTLVCTDIAPDHGPDLVDDIARSTIPDASFSGIFCVSILEHVADCSAAVSHIRRILEPGGEVIIYVPFCYPFHDRTDHHRFTFTELARLMDGYADFRICLADGNGYGGVLTEVLTFHQIHRVPWLWNALSRVVNVALTVPLAAVYLSGSRRGRAGGTRWRDFRFYYTHLHLAHGFWAWGRKPK
jgi:SAM-dependent methyltransferase